MKKVFEQAFLILTIIALSIFVKVSEFPVWFTEHSNIVLIICLVSWFIYCMLDDDGKR